MSMFEDIPVDIGIIYEGERIRGRDMQIELGGPREKFKFELVQVREPEEIEDEKTEIIGKDIPFLEPGTNHPIGILIDVSGKDLEKDLEGVIERRLHEYANYIEGFMHLNQRYDIQLRMSKKSFEKGLNSFYREGHSECCGIRKVEPLNRALKGRRAWATGLRRDQSPATRSDLKHAEYDTGHLNDAGKPLVKINPLLDWTSSQVWDYIRINDVPYNPLHDSGYRSIGCQPCTRPLRPGEHERAARWWWENDTKRECGLHMK